MKIDRASGELVLGPMTLGPSTASGIATRRGVADGEHTWTILTRFANGRLAQISLFVDDAALGTS